MLNSDLTRGIGKPAMPKNEKELEHDLRSRLKGIQLRPDKIQAFFAVPLAFYAA